MNRASRSQIAKGAIILIGAVVFMLAALSLSQSSLTAGFLLLAIFATLLAPRMSLTLPGSRFALSFADASVFLAFLLYGGPAAILLAAVESAANCLYLRARGFKFGRLMLPANVSINTLSFGLTYAIWLKMPAMNGVLPPVGSTQHLIATLCGLALTQFAISSSLAALLFSINSGGGVLSTWRRYCFSSSMAQIVGAGLAGLAYKVLAFGDAATAVLSLVVLAVAYLSYRKTIDEVKQAMSQAEEAERKKSDIERERRHEAEEHAGQLASSLEMQEQANEALRRSESDLQHAALFDTLTDLPNRKQFGDILNKLIDAYKVDPSLTFHVLFLDIRKFKHINDSLGHTFGDKVLAVVAKRIARMINSNDLVARIGGDEFAIILNDLSSVGKAQKVARRLYDSLAQPFSLSGNRVTLDMNIGVAPSDAEYETPEEVLRDADIAMHYAKERNSGVAIFSKELRVRFLERIRLENDLRHAVDRGELSMSYQPIVDLVDGTLFGVEALLRWNHSEIGQIPPNKFIPIAEESGLIIPITNWILEETCNQLAAWQRLSREYQNLIMSVNISGKHLSHEELLDDVENALIGSKIEPVCLKLEITESAAMENAENTISILHRLKKLGVQLSIDDFGTGYSSLSYLHRLPFDTLKIDRSFVSAVGEMGEGSEILQTIISLAKNLKKKVVAEGIETEAQLDLLEQLGCDYGQGYLLAKPLTREKMEAALKTGRTWLPEPVAGVHQSSTALDELPVF
ncbi:MAG TPA: bifunctional diguanylate cyclase/phosphodiesterase [Pyrinomonadaceae bacterium]|jgi:diguanylate cyclase (GGDEF)-like protein|nr:bifunctional diguanylate cyclase/phosphodiesterase [Pyrinomonadaceae bacterium]